jgi:transposase
MRFEEAYTGWQAGRLSQEEAARILGVCERSFRRYAQRYESGGLEALVDKRLSQLSHRRAPVDEVMQVVDLYRARYAGWNVRHFHSWYMREHTGTRSYSWVKNTLQGAGAVKRAKGRGKHRKRRERAPLPGMMVHQDGSTHQWVAGVYWDLIVTMDDATGEHLSMFFVAQEGTASSFHALGQTIAAKGLFATLYTDRGSHYFLTPEAGGKVDKVQLTQVGRALAQLGIHHQGAYSPEARGRSERAFGTHQQRLPRELALAGISDMAQANRYLEQVYRPAYNAQFAVPATEPGSAFVPYIGPNLADILCEQFERTVGKDNCVSFEALTLQIPADCYRQHYVKAKVRVHRYVDGTLAIFHGPRKLADYDTSGGLTSVPVRQAA